MTRSTLILCDLVNRDQVVCGVEMRHAPTGGTSYSCADVLFRNPAWFDRVQVWIDRAREAGERIDDRRTVHVELVNLHDGPAHQHLAPGVAPVPLLARQLAHEAQRRTKRRGHAPLPSGGLFDDVARAQQDLFA